MATSFKLSLPEKKCLRRLMVHASELGMLASDFNLACESQLGCEAERKGFAPALASAYGVYISKIHAVLKVIEDEFTNELQTKPIARMKKNRPACGKHTKKLRVITGKDTKENHD